MSPKTAIRFVAFPLCACAGQFWWMTHYDPTNLVASAIWIPLLTFSWFCIGGVSHELIHGNLGFSKKTDTVIARAIGCLLVIPHSVYREVHMRHHAYLNTPLDFEMWPYCDPNSSLRFRRIFVWFDIVFAIVMTPIIWGRICFAPDSPASPEIRRTMRREYAVAAVFWAAIIGTCVWLHTTGRFQFRVEHWIFALPPFLATICNGFRKMMDHVGTSSFDPILGTRTVIGDNFVTKILSYFNFDLSVHGPHHRYPKLSHTLLKGRMTEVVEANPEKPYRVFPSFSSAIADTLRAIIKNPGIGLNAGCTDDLSHLPNTDSSTWAPRIGETADTND